MWAGNDSNENTNSGRQIPHAKPSHRVIKMTIFEFDERQGIAIVDFDNCYYYPTAKLHPYIEEWIHDNCKGSCSLSCTFSYDYLIFGFPCPYDEDMMVFTIFFEDDMDAIKFKLFWL